MRIVIWTDAFWPEIGGLEIFSMRLVTALRQRGHDCMVIADRYNPRDRGRQDYEGIPVYGTAFHEAVTSQNLALLRREHEECKRLVDEFNPDVFHLNTVMRGIMGFLFQQRSRRRPTLLTLHDNFLQRHVKSMAPNVLQLVDGIVAISESIRDHALAYDPKLEAQMHLVSNALPVPNVSPAPFPGEPRLLAFGRLIESKGFDLAIEAFARIAPHFPHATLTVAGRGVEENNLQEIARKTGYAERIHFPGWVHPEEIPALINRHSLVIMPSRWQEPFGLVAVETAQMGRPIIASRTGGIPEVVVDGVTGKLFENDDVEDLTKSLLFLLENPSIAQQMGEQARLRAHKVFSFEHFVAAYENLYTKVIALNQGRLSG